MGKPRRTVRLSDPRALRALAHPARLALVALLRREGPLTATRAGERIGQSPANCSFHLRQLAKHGLVEEAPGGRGRERPWRATAMSTSWPNVAGSPEMSDAAGLLARSVLEGYLERITAWLQTRADDPVAWQQAGSFGDSLLYLTADELQRLRRGIEALAEPYVARTADAALRPERSRPVAVIHFAFPIRDGGEPS